MSFFTQWFYNCLPSKPQILTALFREFLWHNRNPMRMLIVVVTRARKNMIMPTAKIAFWTLMLYSSSVVTGTGVPENVFCIQAYTVHFKYALYTLFLFLYICMHLKGTCRHACVCKRFEMQHNTQIWPLVYLTGNNSLWRKNHVIWLCVVLKYLFTHTWRAYIL